LAADRPARRRHRIVSIVGTRPEAIKMAPVVRALAGCCGIDQQLVLTGQHRGLACFFRDLGAHCVCELPFDPKGRSAVKLREALHRVLCGHFQRTPADLVLVHGDTVSALAGALAARDCGLAIGHVEAGLRSFDIEHPWPEEGNRMVIDALSDLLFAPTELSAVNLRADWRVAGEIHVTGNTGIDALFHARGRCRPAPAGDAGRRTILVTCHRKENQGAAFEAIAGALKRLVRELPVEIVLPLHTNPHLRRAVTAQLGDEPHVRLVEALEHEEMVALMEASWILLTDSGGLQEEGPALGKPVLVLREVTERPEAMAGDGVALVGTDPARIFAAVAELLDDPDKLARMSVPSLPFGDGHAAPRIVAATEKWLARRRVRVA
jgi:UDP-N-acetylglucosamine 2-epimerase (non-hydrolysing)